MGSRVSMTGSSRAELAAKGSLSGRGEGGGAGVGFDAKESVGLRGSRRAAAERGPHGGSAGNGQNAPRTG